MCMMTQIAKVLVALMTDRQTDRQMHTAVNVHQKIYLYIFANKIISLWRIRNILTSLKIYNSCGWALWMYCTYVWFESRVAWECFFPNSACQSKNVPSQVVVYRKNQSFRYMSRLDRIVCKGNISKIEVIFMHQREELARRTHESLLTVDAHNAAACGGSGGTPGCPTTPNHPLLPWGSTAKAVSSGIIRIDHREESMRATCNFLK